MEVAVQNTFPWYALKVRTGSEPVAVRALSFRGYQPFAPMVQERRRYSDRIKHAEKAVFPGYVFCRFDTRNKKPILSSLAVENIVAFGGVYARIPDEEIAGIQKAVLAGAVPAPYVSIGKQVKVVRGPLTGVRGVVVRQSGRDTFVVSVELLQRSVGLEIETDSLAPVVT